MFARACLRCLTAVGSASYTARSSLGEAQTLTAERASEYDDARSRSASNQSTVSNPLQQTARLFSRVESAVYVHPRFATLLDHMKLAYVRLLRGSGAHEQAHDVVKCLAFPLKFYSYATAQTQNRAQLL